MTAGVMLDLFSGLGGWSRPFALAGWETVTLDFDPRFGADHVRGILTVADLAELEPGRSFGVICASPPCETFSTGSIGRHWGGGARAYEPKSDAARLGLAVVARTFALVDAYVAAHPGVLYVIENPRGVMRKITPRPPTGTTWYCQWGESRAKPTDLWTNAPDAFGGFPSCRNGAPDHDAQSRYYWRRKALGQTGGTQGLASSAERALIPPALAAAVVAYAHG